MLFEPRIRLWAALMLALLAACSRDPAATTRKLVDTGNKYFSAGNYREASIIYRRALQHDRVNAEAYYQLGLAEKRLGRLQQAMGALRRAVDLEPQNESAYGELAEMYLTIYLVDRERFEDYLAELQALTERVEQSKPDTFHVNRVRGLVELSRPEPDYQAAYDYLQRAESQQPGDQKVALGLVESLARISGPEEAIELAEKYLARDKSVGLMYDFVYLRHLQARRFEQARDLLLAKVEGNPESIAFRLQLASHYLGMRQQSEMEAVLRELADDTKRFPDAPRSVGDFYLRINAYDQAYEVYRRGAEALPHARADLRNRMVEVLAIQGRYDEAFNLVEKILDEDDENAAALALRGALRLRTRKESELAEAIADIEAALSRMPDNPVLRYNLAEGYRAQGTLERAVVEYEAAIEMRPDYLAPRYRLGNLYLVQGQYPAAVAEAEKILRFNRNNLQAHLLRASAWIRMGETQQARETLERVVAVDPDARDAFFLLGRLELRAGRFAEAESLFRRLYEGTPRDNRGMLGLVDCYLYQGKPDDALALLRASIEEAPQDLGLQLALGSTLHMTRRLDEAIQTVQSVLRERPDDGIAHRLIGGSYYDKGDFGQADKHLRKAAEILPSDPIPPLYLGMMAERQGALQQAARYYERVLEVAPDNAIALNNLAYILAETNMDLDRALTLIQKARSFAPSDPNVADTLGYVYLRKELPDSALPILEDVVSKYPDVVAWRYHLSMAHAQKGRAREAKQHLETALRHNPTEEEAYKIRELLSRVSD